MQQVGLPSRLFALALGTGTRNSRGEWIEAFFPKPMLSPDSSLISALKRTLDYQGGAYCAFLGAEQALKLADEAKSLGLSDLANLSTKLAQVSQKCRATSQTTTDSHPRLPKEPLIAILDEDKEPQSTIEAYLKLHLISHRLLRPHQTILKGIFSLLPTVAWTSQGPIDAREINERLLNAHLEGQPLQVFSVDKFPRLTDYVVPSGVRIADSARVRLGAYLGEGTTIMHEGFVNFNAGTLGTGMVEGRISAGVVVGAASDLGGGSSIMGTLSGGNDIVISLGEKCLVGANAGVGIPLGDRCTIEAGLYVTGGTKVQLYDNAHNLVKVVKAKELSGMSDLLFRRNSLTGAVEALCNKSTIKLNEELHKNN